MSKTSDKLKWCKVRLGKDLNWWVTETSDKVNWDSEGLSVIDPKQTEHMRDMLSELKEYGFEESILEKAFLPFSIDGETSDSSLKISRIKDSIVDNDEQLFLIPNTLDEEGSPYAEFLDHITKLQIKMLNDCLDFEEEYTIEELETEIRDRYHSDYMEGKAIHSFHEVMDIVEFIPFGYSLEEDDSEKIDKKDDEDYSDIDDISEEEDIKEDETMRWDDDDDSENDFERLDDESINFDDDDDRY